MFCITVALITLTVYLTYRDNQNPNPPPGIRASDAIKCLVFYLQYVVILGSISVPWPSYLTYVFDSASVVFGAASSQILSLDCVLPHYVNASAPPLAVQRQLVNFLAPVAVFVVVILCLLVFRAACKCGRWVGCCRQHRRRTLQPHSITHPQLRVSRHWPIVAMVVVYFAYPTLVTASLSFFACLVIDTPSGPYAEYALRNHSAGYWVYDGLNQECFSGWHKAWALGLGLPLTLVFCLLLPVGVLLFLWLVGSSRAADPSFRELYGFWWRNMKQNRVWWEPVWMVRTVLLSAVAVFHFVLRAFYSMLLLGVMFAGSAVLQAWAKPYAEPRLHAMHLAASSCLFVTAYCSLALFSVTGQASSHAAASIAVSVVIIGLNLGFVLWSIYRIVAAAGVFAATTVAAKAVKTKVGTLCRCQARRLSV